MCNRNVQQGVTLFRVSVIIVFIGILGALAVPQLNNSGEKQTLDTLITQLSQIRSAINRYHRDHNGRYPGRYNQTNGLVQTLTEAEAEKVFLAQLTRYTDIKGKVSIRKDATFKYGPYVNQPLLPNNPFIDDPVASKLIVDKSVKSTSISPSADGTSGWKFYLLLGNFVSNDNVILPDGTSTVDR